MKGYFISETSYRDLGFDKNVDFNAKASKTVIVATEEDFDNVVFSESEKEDFMVWFYQNEMDGLVECARQFGTVIDGDDEE
ncbi:hypothetical protein FACS189427_01370 [Planctomycetales bacterium]|nr:hypothetical protein FACS189427_01370 [Planctomycetales bacterium]